MVSHFFVKFIDIPYIKSILCSFTLFLSAKENRISGTANHGVASSVAIEGVEVGGAKKVICPKFTIYVSTVLKHYHYEHSMYVSTVLKHYHYIVSLSL